MELTWKNQRDKNFTDLLYSKDHHSSEEAREQVAFSGSTQPPHGFLSHALPSASYMPKNSPKNEGVAGKRQPRQAAAAEDPSEKKAKKRMSCSWKKVNLKRDNIAERISELHELVSPLGKRDIASVLEEARQYIMRLHKQIEISSSAYLRPSPSSSLQIITPTSTSFPNEERGEGSGLRSCGLCLIPTWAFSLDMLCLLESLQSHQYPRSRCSVLPPGQFCGAASSNP